MKEWRVPGKGPRWLIAFWAATLPALVGFNLTADRPADHPIWHAFSVTWLLAMAVAMATRAPLWNASPERFGPARWERSGRVYRWMGVDAFGRLLQRSPLGWLSPQYRECVRRADWEGLAREMNYAEGAHWVSGVLTLALAAAYALKGLTTAAAAFGVWAVFFHAYPALLQRRNRPGVLRLMKRAQDAPEQRPRR